MERALLLIGKQTVPWRPLFFAQEAVCAKEQAQSKRPQSVWLRREARRLLGLGISALGRESYSLHYSAYGAPFIHSHGQESLAVSFSYTAERAFCLLYPCPLPLGLDVEAISLAPHFPWARVFSACEQRALRALSTMPKALASEQVRRWTIKEALSKALGLGLAFPFPELETGQHFQRQGQIALPQGIYAWRSIAICGFWLSYACKVPAVQSLPLPHILWR